MYYKPFVRGANCERSVQVPREMYNAWRRTEVDTTNVKASGKCVEATNRDQLQDHHDRRGCINRKPAYHCVTVTVHACDFSEHVANTTKR